MPMGLVNAMAIWSRFIDTAMEGMKEFVLCYADDVLIYTKHKDVEKHIEDLENVFKRLEKNGIKIKASKMRLGLNQIPFLGVTITQEGIQPNPEKIEAIANGTPKNTQTIEERVRNVCVLQTLHSEI